MSYISELLLVFTPFLFYFVIEGFARLSFRISLQRDLKSYNESIGGLDSIRLADGYSLKLSLITAASILTINAVTMFVEDYAAIGSLTSAVFGFMFIVLQLTAAQRSTSSFSDSLLTGIDAIVTAQTVNMLLVILNLWLPGNIMMDFVLFTSLFVTFCLMIGFVRMCMDRVQILESIRP